MIGAQFGAPVLDWDSKADSGNGRYLTGNGRAIPTLSWRIYSPFYVRLGRPNYSSGGGADCPGESKPGTAL